MRQIRVHGPNDVRLDDIPDPQPGPRDALVRIAACGICGTDVSFIHMGGITGGPMPLGHELAGTVDWIGAEVTELIQGYVVAMNLETTEEELMHTVFPHPTISEAMHESVLDAYKRVIHI